jgi:DNA polymerase I-like protein with 3'-5' exonuclease and polymerase domains
MYGGEAVGELAKAVAELEQQLEEAQELSGITDRLDAEIAANLDEIESIGSAAREAHYELDNQIAEHDYSAVEQTSSSVAGLILDPQSRIR